MSARADDDNKSERDSDIWNADRKSQVGFSSRATFVEEVPPMVNIVTPRLLPRNSLDMKVNSPIRNRIAKSIRIGSPPGKQIITGEDELLSIKRSQTNFLVPIIVTILLIGTSLITFFIVLAIDSGGFSNLGYALSTSKAAMLAITMAICLVPVGLICIGLSTLICRPRANTTTTIAVIPEGPFTKPQDMS